ncbi:MAG: polymer-forming cytoskeletal protein [Chloroflexota bacterium]|nr:MAG: polymer-forming cytoskeletal protein [Chloroflexota bacterium]
MPKFQFRILRLSLVVLAVMALALGLAGPAEAVEFDDDGLVAAGEVVDDDLFLTADALIIDGQVNGNLFAFGSSLTVNGVVNGDLIVNSAHTVINGVVNGSVVFAGRTLVNNGEVSGTIYGAGSSLALSSESSVGRNVFFAGFGIETEPGSRVERDLLMTGYQARLAGEVKRDVSVDVEALEIFGTVGRNVHANVSEPPQEQGGFSIWRLQWPGMPVPLPEGLRIDGDAQISGKLSYTSPIEQAGAILAQPGGGVQYNLPAKTITTQKEQPGKVVVKWLLNSLRSLVTLLALGSLALWQLPGVFERTAAGVRRPVQSAGLGFVVAFLGYAAGIALTMIIFIVWILLLVVSLGGLSEVILSLGFSGLGLAMALFSLMVAYGSKLIVSYHVGRWIFKHLSPSAPIPMFWPLLVGVLIYILLRSIPLGLGWLVGVFVTLVGVGSLWRIFREWRLVSRGGDAPVEPVSGLAPQLPAA